MADSEVNLDDKSVKSNNDILSMHVKLLRNILTSDALLAENSTRSVIETISLLLSDFDEPLSLLPSKTSKDITSLVSIVSAWLCKCVETNYCSNSQKNDILISKATFLLLKLTSLSGSLSCALICAKTLIENDSKLSDEYIEKLHLLMLNISQIQSEFSLNANLTESSSLFLNSFKFLFPNHVETIEEKKNASTVNSQYDQQIEVEDQIEAYSCLAVGPNSLYIHTSCGLAAVSSGFGSSTKGKLVVLNESFHNSDPGWLIYSNTYLYFKSKTDKTKIIVICPEKLIEIGSYYIPLEYQNVKSPLISLSNNSLFKSLFGGNLISTLICYEKVEIDSISKLSVTKTFYDFVILETPSSLENELIFVSRVNLTGWPSMSRQPTTCQICKKCGIFTSYISCYLWYFAFYLLSYF